jgi:hypothetical protein
MDSDLNATPSAGSDTGSTGSESFVGDLLSAEGDLENFASPDTASTSTGAVADNPADSSDDETPVVEGEQSETTETQTQATSEGGKTLEQLAAEYGMDASNPNHRKALELIAAAANTESAQQTGGEEGAIYDELTDFEKSLVPDDAAPADANATAEQTEKPEPGKFGDIGDAWKAPSDALQALSEAYTPDENGKVNYDKVNEVELAIFARRFQAFMPWVDKAVEAFVKTNFGDLYQDLQVNRRNREYQQSYQSVVDGLKGQKGLEDIDKMFQADGTFEHKGKKFDNSPYNRVLRDNPLLLNIRVDRHPATGKFLDPKTAEKFTIAARMKEAHRLWKQSKNVLPASDVQKVVKAGAQAQERNAQHRTRQALNAGGGASAAGSGPAAGNSFVSSLQKRSAGVLSLDDL